MILEGKNIFDGRELTKRTWNRTYTGLISGNFKINDNGDGEKDISIHDFDSEGNLHVSIVWSPLLMIITVKSKRNKYKISFSAKLPAHIMVRLGPQYPFLPVKGTIWDRPSN